MKNGKPNTSFGKIWAQFSVDRKRNRAAAYAHLQQNLASCAEDLVPQYFTSRELFTTIADIEEHTKSDQQSNSGDPITIMGEWLRGEVDLSRTKMEKVLPIDGDEEVA